MLKFEIPPLRSRRPDIVPLAKKFISEHSARHGVEIRMVDESLYSGLMRYPWPGNVRELEHVIQRAVIYCRDGVLSARQLPSHVLVGEARPGNDGQLIEAATPGSLAGRSLLGRHVALSEREIIEETLFQNNQSRTNTARALGISRVTLYNKMKKYGMTRALGAGLPDGL
jgi:DNA-binding NtrC family response regulator